MAWLDEINISDEELATILSEVSRFLNATIKITSGPARRGSNAVYRLESSSTGKAYSLRILLDAENSAHNAKGIKLLQALKAKVPTLAAPAMYLIAEKFVLLEYLAGETLDAWDMDVLSEKYRHRLLDDLAVFLFAIWRAEIPQEEGPLQGPCTSYETWLRADVDRGVRRSILTCSRWGEPIHYLTRRLRIKDILPSGVDEGRLAVCHGDLNAANIIVKDKENEGGGLSGIIDWHGAKFVPAAAAIYHPIIIANTPGWHEGACPPP